jgi:pimeloyl-ACP methyl ester carboxylesterase
MKQRIVEVEGQVGLAVAEAGVGGAPLLLLHGFTGAKEDFGDWMDRLGDEGWHTVAPDLRGHGESSKPEIEEAYSLEVMAADAFALADALGWGRFVLLGHSMGGMVAQIMALKEPGRLRGLVLMNTHHGAIDSIDPEIAAAGADVARTQGMTVLGELISQLTNPLDSPADTRVRAERPGYAEFGDRKFAAASPSMYAAMVGSMFGAADRLDRLTALDLPTLVLVGEQDKGFLAPSERMAAALPQGTYRCLPDAGHSPQFENPDAWWSAMSEFLASIRPPGAPGPNLLQ